MDMTPRPDQWFESGIDLASGGTRLRRPTIQDTDAVLQIFRDAPTTTGVDTWRPMRTTAEAREFLSSVIGGWAARRPAWFVEDAATGQVVGAVLADCDRSEVELSYVVARAWTGRGHATAAVRLIAEGAFTDPAVERVRAYCDADSAAPARVLEKAGFERRPGLAELNDCVCYVRTRPPL